MKAFDALGNTQNKLRRSKEKPLGAYKSILSIRNKCSEEEVGALNYLSVILKIFSEEVENIHKK